MATSEDLILVGGFSEIVELAEDCKKNIIGIIEPPLGREGDEIFGYPILGSDAEAREVMARYPQARFVLSPDLGVLRQKLAGIYRELGAKFASLIHPEARVARTAEIGEGAVIQWGAHVSSQAQLGDFVKLNVNANIMHDVVAGDFATIAPDAVILGRVSLGKLCYIGANATVLPDVQIGEGTIVGANAAVTRDLGKDVTVVGVPAKVM